MNTIAKVALIAVIVFFTGLLLWGLWMPRKVLQSRIVIAAMTY
ncbi:MAG TPA: hypothetical protein VGY14_03345 [Methyloceanibacter sp.]|jgi:hypothetical protein|nr:hypothetical protein [Methyloceanibacter sp.]